MIVYHLYRQISNALERGFYIETSRELLDPELKKLRWLIGETFEPDRISSSPFFEPSQVVEIGPRLAIGTPFSSNAVQICHAIGLHSITRFEQTHRYVVPPTEAEAFLQERMDPLLEQHYPSGIETFITGVEPDAVQTIDLIGGGQAVLEEANQRLGLGMDTQDIAFYLDLFVTKLKRDPTDVELFQLANANSEHCRHWFFRGQIVIDGTEMPRTLFEIVQEPLVRLQAAGNTHSLVAFRDDAGVLSGFQTPLILPSNPGRASEMQLVDRLVHITATCETHNHPTSVEPFQGGATGAGGRLRDQSAVGRGGIPGMGIAGYAVGNLFIPEHAIPSEEVGRDQPSDYAQPLGILIKGSDGVSAYCNQFGEPAAVGFCRTFGLRIGEEWYEYRKPILFSGGVGHLFGEHTEKEEAGVGMHIVRIGGPAYPVGVGGGSASSMMIGENAGDLDLASVQRGDPEMGNRTIRVLRTCASMGDQNPISSLHDQGAGGPSNVLTELIETSGGKINVRKIVLGDQTMGVLTIWSAEFQEGFGLLIQPRNLERFQAICTRERVNCEVLGEVDGKGKIILEDPMEESEPVNLNLADVLTELPQKRFESNRIAQSLPALDIPGMAVAAAVEAVFRLPSVGSKGHLVHKVDRSVGGLIVQQQCCGIEQIAIANMGILAQSHFGETGSVVALGERPINMLIDPAAGARLAVAEMLTNMASAGITDIGAIRCRANWMWPAKLPGEGARLYDAAVAMSELMIELGIAIDGGKDSSSLASKVDDTLVKSPGTLVITGYAPMDDINRKVTPDIKAPGQTKLGLIDLGRGKNRLGGSALAQANNQIGNETPDVDAETLRNAFNAVQTLIKNGWIRALHDRSDGGLITTVAEMCMASRCGFSIRTPSHGQALKFLFNEELGFVFEYGPEHHSEIHQLLQRSGLPFMELGETTNDGACRITADDTSREVFNVPVTTLRGWWEATSDALNALQIDSDCAQQEVTAHTISFPSVYDHPNYQLTFTPKATESSLLKGSEGPRVAILREEGSNGDTEMAAAFKAAGFTPWDITMQDLLTGAITLDEFQGLVPVGGFSYMDVCDSAKGWAATILFNDALRAMFDRFYAREDTFSLGVCNGCQLLALLGWVPWKGIEIEKQPRFIRNHSRRFESRWVQVGIQPSPSILFNGMKGSKLGVWVAHGEGRLHYPDEGIMRQVHEKNLAPLAFLDPHGNPTVSYPHNPNGSLGGVTALCSVDGRHTAMMPHMERCFRLWQWPWMSPVWAETLEASPWIRAFQNARVWCEERRP